MLLGVLIPVAILGALVLIASALFRRQGAEGTGLDLSPRTLLRTYLYIASLAGVILLVVGLASLVNVGLAAAGGSEFVYGRTPGPVLNCPPGAPAECFDRSPLRAPDAQRRRDEDLIRGITFTSFGLLFWGAHWGARRGVVGDDERGSPIRRGYLLLGTVIFGLTTIVLLPSGVYQALTNLLLPAQPNTFHAGVSDSLGGGIAALPVWLLFLRQVVRDFRGRAPVAYSYPGGGTGGEPAGVGAALHTPPSGRGASAEAPLSPESMRD